MRIRAAVIGERETVERLRRVAPIIRAALREEVQRLTLKLLRKVKQEKLSGQVLNVVTGRLRRSINQRVEEQGAHITGYVGTNVRYARIHEFGGTFLLPPRERKTYWKMDKEGNLKGFAKKSKANFEMTHAARSVGTYVTMPERSFLRSALAEMKNDIQKGLRSAAIKAAKAAG